MEPGAGPDARAHAPVSFLDRGRRELIARRLPLFALGWLGAMGLWLVVFALEARLAPAEAVMVGLQAAILGAAAAAVRARPHASRVLLVSLTACILLGASSTALFALVHGYGEVLAFVLLSLYLAAASLFSWGWRAELVLLASTLAPCGLVLSAFDFFVPPLELGAAVTIGAVLSLAIAEGSARGLRFGLRREASAQEMTRALAASRDAYRDLAEKARDFIWTTDAEGRFTYVNDAAARYLGARPAELVGRSIAEFMTDHPENPDLRSSLARLMSGEALVPLVVEGRTPQGPRWVEVVGSAVHAADGTPIGVRAIGRDVTERRWAEERRRESEARYRGLVESAQELVTRFDLEGRLTFANDSYCRAIGCAREEIVGQNPLRFVHEDERPETLAAFRAATAPPYRCRIESRGLTPDGWRWFEWEVSGVRGADDRVVEIQQVGREVTARKHAEAALRESEERFRSAFEDASIGMAVAGPDGQGLRVNRAFCDMLGYSEAEMLTMTARDITHPDDLEATIAAATGVLAGEARSYQLEKRYLHKRGHVVWVWVTSSLVRDAHGTPLYFIAQMQDVTERKLAEEALRASLEDLRRSEEKLRLLAQRQVTTREEERKRLGFDLHDDVCQELVGIGILVESLRRKMAPMAVEHAAEFDRVVGYLGEVVEHLRLLARELRPVLLHDLGLDGSLRSLADGMSSATTHVVTDFRTPIPRLDEEVEVTIYRIAQEALANAVRHAGASSIVISLAAVEGRLRLEVRDDGCGFDPAARRDAALGLVSMEERAQALGGRLDLRSAPGKGTIVRLECPAVRAPASAA